jgi:putative transposase
MISYSHGLVLQLGERLMKFVRRLDQRRVQFEFTDNGELVTETIDSNYRGIRDGKYKLFRAVPAKSKEDKAQQDDVVMPSQITKEQEEKIAYQMLFVKAAMRAQIKPSAHKEVRALIDRVIAAYANTSDKPASALRRPSEYAVRNWITRYKRNGSSAFALVDRRQVVKPVKRAPIKVDELIDEGIRKHYLKLRGSSINATHGKIEAEILQYNENQGVELTVPSLSTVTRRVADLPKYQVDVARFGKAFAKNKWRYSMHGDQSTRIMERVEIDHTMLDIWVLDPISGLPLGRPWITILIDRYSGYITGLFISFFGPSTSTIASALKMSIEPKGDLCEAVGNLQNTWDAYGVAELYVMDNGLEMHSQRFRRIGWELQADFLYNPVRQPWLKASIERTMMEVCRVLPVQGKVYSPIKNAQVADPKKTASILFDDLCKGLIMWAVDVYPLRVDRYRLCRPIDLWADGLQSMPPAKLPESTVSLDLTMGISLDRTISRDGLIFQYLRFNSPELQDYCRSVKQTFRTECRIIPEDIGSVYVLLPKENRWISVGLVRPAPEYGAGLSLLQHQLIRKEAGKKLAEKNAQELFYSARERLSEAFKEAAARGKSLNRQTNLVRMQNLTSARLGQVSRSDLAEVPEASPMLKQNLEKHEPYRSFLFSEE